MHTRYNVSTRATKSSLKDVMLTAENDEIIFHTLLSGNEILIFMLSEHFNA